MTEIPGKCILLPLSTSADIPDLLRLWNDGRLMRWAGFPDGLGDEL